MKTLILMLGLVASCIVANAANLTGRWQLTQDIVGNKSTTVMVLTQEGETLSGTITLGDKQVPLTGKIADGKITWEYGSEWEGTPLTMIYAGTLDASGDISGTVEVDPFETKGEFRAKRLASSE